MDKFKKILALFLAPLLLGAAGGLLFNTIMGSPEPGPVGFAVFRPYQGGTGTGTAPNTGGKFLISTSGGVYTPAYITAGTNITVATSSGGFTINASGATFGSENEVPSVNATTDDFDYSSNLTFDGSLLDITGTASVSGTLEAGTFNGNFTTGSVLFAGSSGQITQDNANFFWDDTGNNLGIGTTGPVTRLDIPGFNTTNSAARIGQLEFSSFSNNNNFIGSNTYYNGGFIHRNTGYIGLYYFQDDEGQYRFFNSAAAGTDAGNGSVQLKISRSGAFGVGSGIDTATGNFAGAFFYVNSAGNVGIGTTSQIGKLDVVAGAARTGTHATTPSFYVTGDLADGQSGPTAKNIEFRHSNGTQGIGFGYNTIYQTGSNTNQSLNFLSRGSGAITLNAYPYSTGNVGIGTTSPITKFEVQGTASASNLLTVGSLQVANGGSTVSYSRFGTNATSYSSYLDSSDDLLISDDLEVDGQAFFDGNASVSGDFEVGNTASVSGDVYLALTSGANVGIGTTGPAQLLDVAGNSTPILSVTTANTLGGFLGRSSNGTLSSPTALTANQQLFSVGGSGYGTTAWSGTKAILKGLAAENWTDTAQGAYLTLETTPIGSTTRAERVRIDSTGNVGIGTTAPALKFHVASTSEGNVLRLQDTDGTCDHDPDSGSEVVTCSSDESLKLNIRDYGNATGYLRTLRIREYEIGASGKTAIGTVAQEVQGSHPELVSPVTSVIREQIGTEQVASGSFPVYRERTETHLGVQQPNPWVLVRAIQELDARVKTLEQKVAVLERGQPVGGPPFPDESKGLFERIFQWILNLFK